jgi:hypothetical protein
MLLEGVEECYEPGKLKETIGWDQPLNRVSVLVESLKLS